MKEVPTRLSRFKLFCYGITDMPLHFALTPVLVFIPRYYSANLGVSLLAVANLIMAVRLFDILTDPLVGYLSDRTHTRWGRRRPWIVAATPLMMGSFYMLFLPLPGAGAGYMFACMMALSLAMTMMMIPYYAWAAELSSDYNERSRITGWRSAIGVAGNMVVQYVPILFLLLFGYGGTEAVLTILGILMVLVLPFAVALTVTQVPETKSYVSSTTPLGKGLKLMWGNGPFKRLIAALMVGSTAFNITTPLYAFYIADILGAEKNIPVMLAFFYTANISAVPFWVWISKRISKHRAYAASFIIIGIANPFYLLLGPGDFWWMIPITLVSGFAGGAFAAMPNSMKADVIDLDNMMSGDNRAASFFATWSFTSKMSAALGSWIALNVLALIGYNAELGSANTPENLLQLKLLFTLVPSIFFFGAAALVWNYPITEARHQRMRAALERRNARRAQQQ